MNAVEWVDHWPAVGNVDFRLGYDGDDVVAEWVGVGTLRASRCGTRSSFVPAGGLDEARLEKLYGGVIEAFLWQLRGGLTLHASAVRHGDAVLALMGHSGAGKSTAVAELCRRSDMHLVGDDTLAIDLRDGRAYVKPTQAVHWLLPDAARALGHPSEGPYKSACAPRSIARGEGVLEGIVGLVFDDKLEVPTLQKVEGHDAFVALSTSMFRFILDDPAVQARDFAQLARLYEMVPVYVLRRPKRFDRLARSGDVLASLIARHEETA